MWEIAKDGINLAPVEDKRAVAALRGVEDDGVDPRLRVRLIFDAVGLDPSSLDHTSLEDRKSLFDRVQLDKAPCSLILVVDPI